MGLRTNRARVARAVFPPEQVAAVKAVSCELSVRYGLPLGRFSRTELYRLVIELAVTEASRRRSGDGCMRTRSDRGSSSAGSTSAIRVSP